MNDVICKDQQEKDKLADALDLAEANAKEQLLGVIGKKFALKYREYGPFDPKKVDETGKKIASFPFFSRVFEHKELPEIQRIAAGDMNALEKEIRKEIIDTATQPVEHWWPVSANAKDFTESIKKNLLSGKFADMDPDAQVSAYHKMLAARTSVDAVRGSFRGKSLDKDINQGIYSQTMNALDRDGSAVTKALKNMIQREGKEKVRDWAGLRGSRRLPGREGQGRSTKSGQGRRL